MRQWSRCPTLFLLVTVLALTACSGPRAEDNDTSGGAGGDAAAPEPAICTTTTTYSNPVTVSATAQYQYRRVCAVVSGSCTQTGLFGDPVTTGIPYAEVVISKTDGTVVQCGSTDSSGNISLAVPSGAGAYVLTINSRADSNKLKVSVLEDRATGAPYALTTSFNVGSGQTSFNAGTLIATARMSESAKLEGGAFNILAQIAKANDYLRSTLNDSTFVAPKVTVYWKAGFNPYSYFGHASTPLSFYRNGLSELYILGGANGDVKNSDTDHFDNSVILHEYGHFLEDMFAVSESPGGSHDGDFIIDPRLAWSEGWANFYQGAVIGNADANWKWYVDTIGFRGDSSEGSGSSAQIAIRFDLTQPGASATYDSVADAGEGTFREVSISRFLFKTIRTVANGGAEVPFKLIWKAFSTADVSGAPKGFASAQVAFRNIGLFNKFLAGFITSDAPTKMTDWDAVRSDEKQNNVPKDFANPLNLQAENSCAAIDLSPVRDLDHYGIDRSNLLLSNDFYTFVHDGSNQTITLSYTGGSANHDLDLYIYSTDYLYYEEQQEAEGDAAVGLAIRSARLFSLEGGTEQVNLSGIPAGTYLVNVKAHTYQKTSSSMSGAIQYKLKVTHSNNSREDLCPAN